MATLLVEIGCEELPAAACREAERQLPELCRHALGVDPTQILVTPRRLAVLVEDVPERDAGQWLKGPPVAMREKAAAGFAKRHGVAVDELEERDGALGVEVPGKAIAEVLPEQVDAILRGLSFSKTMRWDDGGLRFPRPVRWTLAMVDSDKVVGEQSPTATGSRQARSRSRRRRAYLDTLRAADVEPDRVRAQAADRGGARCARGLDRPERRARRGRLPRRAAGGRGRAVRRALPAAAEPRHRDDDSTSHPGVSARREPVRVRRERRRARDSALGRRERRRGPPGRRLVHVRARRQGGNRRPRRASRLDHVLRRRRHVRGQDHTPRQARRSPRRGRGGARGRAACEGRPGLRASPGVPRARGSRRRGVRTARRLSRRRSRPRSTSSTCPTRPTRRSRRPRPGASSPPPTRSTRSTSPSSSATGRPALATPTGSGGRRSASAGSRPRATSRFPACALMEGDVAEFVEERFEGLLDVAGRVRARRAPGIGRATSAVSRGWPRRSPLCPMSGSGRSTRPTRARAGSRRRRKAPPPSSTRRCSSTMRRSRSRRRSSASTRRSPPPLDAGDFGAAVEAAAELGPLLDTFFEKVLVLAEDRAVRANRLRLLLNVRDTLGRSGRALADPPVEVRPNVEAL